MAEWTGRAGLALFDYYGVRSALNSSRNINQTFLFFLSLFLFPPTAVFDVCCLFSFIASSLPHLSLPTACVCFATRRFFVLFAPILHSLSVSFGFFVRMDVPWHVSHL